MQSCIDHCKDGVRAVASCLQADLAAEEAAATEAALRKRGQNVDDMEASISRRETALGEGGIAAGAEGVCLAFQSAEPGAAASPAASYTAGVKGGSGEMP